MGLAVWALTFLLAPWLASGLALRLAALAVLVGGGLAVFACLALAFGAATWSEVRLRLGRAA